MKKDHEHAIALLKAQNDAQLNLVRSERDAAQKRIAELVEQNAKLNDQLNTARAQVESIAKDAVQSAAGRQAFEAVKGIAEQQAQGVGQKR
jgi:septal ring factor EnvC (AmiA/AmiB activator)